jgi:hypothetical protein
MNRITQTALSLPLRHRTNNRPSPKIFLANDYGAKPTAPPSTPPSKTSATPQPPKTAASSPSSTEPTVPTPSSSNPIPLSISPKRHPHRCRLSQFKGEILMRLLKCFAICVCLTTSFPQTNFCAAATPAKSTSTTDGTNAQRGSPVY